MIHETISEILAKIDSLETSQERKDALAKQANNIPLKIVLQYAFNPKPQYKMAFDEEWTPTFKKAHKDDYTVSGRLYAEARGLKKFVLENYPTLADTKRKTLFIDLLESVDGDDAELLLYVKNKSLPFANVNAKLVKSVFPDLLK